ncbi:Leucine-rich repeat protein kinase family protein [Perilla frutescens var. hirtella]|nr:Leucine-rich repeat protein kinase family protein [Perilla frutescens var. frutescens]KAH6794774.1 Leucine-rich repeat protein kinase family protein [Perilla frutescens var. hirtella]
MAKPPLFLLCFFTLTIFAQSKLNLLPSDHEALLQIHKDLGIKPTPAASLCDSAGVFCERQIVNDSYVLRVVGIAIESQHLNGKISPAIGQLSELKELSLPNNQISDQIPPQIIHCQKLEVLNLGNNLFSGRIPPGLSSLIRLRILDLSSNKFTGKLKFLKHFPNLERLNLANNMFAGKVPVSLRSYRNLRFINISGNSLLEGPVPLTNDQLDQYLSADLAEESIPKRYVFAERNKSNLALPPSSSVANAQAPSPSATPAKKHKKTKKKKKLVEWILGFLAGILAGCVSGLIFSMVFKMLMRLIRAHRNDTSLKIFSSMIKKPEDLAFLEKEDGLQSLEIIGRGGCGEVYRAALPGSDGKEIAIKKIIQPPRDAEDLTEEDSKLLNKKMRQIRSEIQTMGQIRHRNLLSLLAHLPRPDCHYLVYEYMKNGSLQDYLKLVSEGKRELDWLARYNIALGVAAGLEYLHMHHNPRIIHRDLKPANVLLDDEMEARIADFGLAKAVPDAQTHVTTSNVAGTVGYIAPEYYQTFKFTEKCDMYSFGVLLGVLIIGKMPSDEFFQHTDEMGLVKWMRNVMTSEDPKRAIDPKLLGSGYEEQMLLVLKVACFCTLDNPKERPNSKDARCMLSQIRN